jgi:hypothetical protein
MIKRMAIFKRNYISYISVIKPKYSFSEYDFIYNKDVRNGNTGRSGLEIGTYLAIVFFQYALGVMAIVFLK